jgi:hypothetical protein
MTRIHRSALASATLAVAALPSLGCKDDPPVNATPVPTTETTAPAPKQRMNRHALNPSLRHLPMRAIGSGAPPGSAASAPGAVPSGAADGGAEAASAARTWSFDKEKADDPPAGFALSALGGRPGKWLVKAVPGAPSGGNVLAQLDADAGTTRLLTAVLADPPVRDARVSVKCKLVSGKTDQACGVVVRFKDANAYYVARADALQKDVSLFAVKDGKLSAPIGAAKTPAFGDAWHELRVEAKGTHLDLFWDGARVGNIEDKTLPDAGRVGLWTKGDSVVYFDELSVTAL